MKKNEIYKVYGTDYKAMTKELLKAAKLKKQIEDKGGKECRIGIKPNLVSATAASHGATTHPEVVAGIIEYLRERQFSNLVMLEGSWVGAETAEAAEVCGYTALSEKYGVPFLDTQKDAASVCDCGGMEIRICDSARSLDFLINVPVLKGHCQTGITCALKNLKGLIPNTEKRRFHTMGLHRPIAHLAAGIRQDFIVVDHICGDPDFEEGGNPAVTNCVMAARDPVLCDAYACKLLGHKKKDVPYIGLAEELGVGSAKLSELVIREPGEKGEKKKGTQKEEGKAKSRKKTLKDLKKLADQSKACSSCYSNLLAALERLEKDGCLPDFPQRICIGQGFRKKSGELGIGSCTKRFSRSLKGCPPKPDAIYKYLKEQGK